MVQASLSQAEDEERHFDLETRRNRRCYADGRQEKAMRPSKSPGTLWRRRKSRSMPRVPFEARRSAIRNFRCVGNVPFG